MGVKLVVLLHLVAMHTYQESCSLICQDHTICGKGNNLVKSVTLKFSQLRSFFLLFIPGHSWSWHHLVVVIYIPNELDMLRYELVDNLKQSGGGSGTVGWAWAVPNHLAGVCSAALWLPLDWTSPKYQILTSSSVGANNQTLSTDVFPIGGLLTHIPKILNQLQYLAVCVSPPVPGHSHCRISWSG